ncbi:hypothetical protein K525DRAFT_209451 [Schizophyllum commune Loenen D]|nr:hypothetical protein K525DRAFT_209451 [Schizophyllum commune Loenen D]
MATARNIPTAFPELDYGEPPKDKESRRSRSRSLRSVANLVLGKQNTKPSPNESNPPAPTSRWPSISALRRSQKTTLPPPFEVPSSAGDASTNAVLYTRDRRSADIPNRRFSLSRPIRLSLNLARPAKRGAIEAGSNLEVRRAAFFVRLVVADHHQAQAAIDQAQAAGHDGVGDSHSRYLRRRLEELEVDGASTQVLAGDASSHTTTGDASTYDRAPSSDDGAYNVSTMDGSVEPSLLELDVDAVQVAHDVGLACLEPDAASMEPDAASMEPYSALLEPNAASLETGSGHGETGPPLTQAHDTFLAVSADEEEPAYADEEEPVHRPDYEVDGEQVNSEQINSAKGQPTSPHVAFAEHVVEYGPGLLDLVHSCYEDGDSSDAEVGGDEEAYHGDEEAYHGDNNGYHDLDDGYHGDDELLYSSDDEDFYAYPSNAMFDVSSHTSSTASAAASNHILTSTVAYVPIHEAPAANILAAVPFTSRTRAVPFTSRAPVSIPFTSCAPAAILPSAVPPVPDDAYDHHAPQYDQHHTPQYAAFFSESPSSYDVAMDFLPLSDLEGTPVDEAGASLEVYENAQDRKIVEDSENVQGSDNDAEADLIFPDEVSFPINPVIYETREGGRRKQEDMPLWTGDTPSKPSFDVPLEPLLGPLLKEERGVWRDDEATPLPPLQMDRLPWLDGSDEEESPLSPTDGADSLLSPPSFGAELPTLVAESLSLNEKLAVPFGADIDNFPAGDNADFALFPTDPRSLPYLLRLSAEYDGTPASELNGSPFPSPLPRSPFDENVLPFADASALPFASLSAQEIATGHQLVRRGRAGVVARRVVVERQSSQAQGDTMAQVGSSVQVEIGSVVQVDPTVLVDIAASSPLDVFLPHVRSPAFAPDLLDFLPAPSPFGELEDGMQFSQSRALVRRPTEGEMMVVRSEMSGEFPIFVVQRYRD